MSSPEDQNRRDFADVMGFFGGTPVTGPRPVDSKPFYSAPSVPSGPYDDLIRDAAAHYGVREDVARAMAYTESGFNPRAVGQPTKYGTAKGLYQFLDQTAAEEKIDAFDPAQATDAAVRRLRQHLDQFGGRYDLAVAAHILGPTGVAQSGGQFDPEVSDYVGKILGSPQRRTLSDFDEVMSFMTGPPSTPKPSEPEPRPTIPVPEQLPATGEPEPSPPLALPPLQRATPRQPPIAPPTAAQPSDPASVAQEVKGQPSSPLWLQTRLTRQEAESGAVGMGLPPYAGPTMRAGPMTGPGDVAPLPGQPTPFEDYPGMIVGGITKGITAGMGAIPGVLGMLEQAGATADSDQLRAEYGLPPQTPEERQAHYEQGRKLIEFGQGFGQTTTPEPVGALAHTVDFFTSIPGYMLNPLMGAAGAVQEPVAAMAEKLIGVTADEVAAARAAKLSEYVIKGAGRTPAEVAAAQAMFDRFKGQLSGASLRKATAELTGHVATGAVFGVLSTVPDQDERPDTYALRAIVNGGQDAAYFGFYSLSGAALRAILGMAFGSVMGRTPDERMAAQRLLKANADGGAVAPEDLDFYAEVAATAQAKGVDASLAPRIPQGQPEEPAADAATLKNWQPWVSPTDKASPVVQSSMIEQAKARMALYKEHESIRLWDQYKTVIANPAQISQIEAGLDDQATPKQPIMQAIQQLLGDGRDKIEATQRQLAVERTRVWKPWISEGEIQAQGTVEDLDRLMEVAKNRREAAREKRILERATPQELSAYKRPGAPQKLILKAIEDRIAVPPPAGRAPTVTEEDIQAAIGKARLAKPAAVQAHPDVPSETTYRGAAERLRARLGGTVTPAAPLTAAPVAPPSAPIAAPVPAERRAPAAREVDLTKIRTEIAAFATDYVKRAGKGGFEVEKFGPLNRDEERLLADAVEEAGKRRPPAPGQKVFLTPEEQEYVTKFREAKGKGQPPPEPPRKGPTSKRRETMEAKLGHWWGVILEQGAISRDSLMRTYVGEDPTKLGYKESLKTFNEIVAGLNKKWGAGMIVRTEGGMRLDEAAQNAAEKGFAGGDPIEARNKILEMIDELSGRKPAKVSGKRKGFGQIDPELATMTRDVAAGDLREGESFTTGDGDYYTVTRKAPGEITLSNGPGKTLKLDEFDLVPIAGRAAPRAYAASGAPREMAQAARTGDPFQDADAELKELLFTTGTYQVAKGAITQERLEAALTKEIGLNIGQYVPGLWRLLTRLPGMRRFITPQEVPRGSVAGRGVPVEQRPEGAAAGGRVPAAGGSGRGELPGGFRQAPAAPTGTATAAAPSTAARTAQALTIDRTQTDRGVATISRELLPELTGPGKAFQDEYSTPERLAEMTQKFGGKRPMRHQVEQAARAIMAFAKGHAYVNGDGTGTGKTLTTGIVIDSILRKKPDARIMIVARNPGIMKQWHADVLGPMGLKVQEVKAAFKTEKGVVNFVTYTRLQILQTSNLLGLVEGYHPDLLVFDESHALKKWYAGTTKWAQAGEAITDKRYSQNVLFLSATPFESILHTGYLTRTDLWTNWRKWLEDTMQIRFNPEKERWEGLTPAKVRRMHEALVRQGRMGKNEIDFAALKNSNGQPITLTSENVLVPLTEENSKAYASMNAVFDGYLEEALMDNDRAKLRMLRGIQHFFRRSYDEAHKLPAAIERARKDVANGKTALFFLLRKNDSSVEQWWNRYEENPDRYPAGSRMPQILEALKHVQPPIQVPSPVKLIQDAFPDAVKITGDETAGGTEREKNIQSLMQGKAKVGIITIAAGAEALNLQDKIGTHPRVSYIVSTPYTASTAKQVMGRGFRLGSESSAEILWLFNDTPSDRTIATNMAWLSRMMGAAVSGEVENPNADDLERFMFPELDANASNGGTARDMADDDLVDPARGSSLRARLGEAKFAQMKAERYAREASQAAIEANDRLILESPPDPKTGKPAQKEMFQETPRPASQEEMLRQRRLELKRKMIEAKSNPLDWDDDTLFGAEEKKDVERRQAQLPTDEPKPRDMAGTVAALRVPGRPTKPSGRPWLWSIWEKLGVTEKARIKSRNQMLNDYLRGIGLKSLIGRMGMVGRNIRARYWPGAQYARRRTAHDVEAAVHESGHYLDEILFGLDPSGDLGSVSSAEMRQFRGELLPLATPAQGRDPFPEGLAEFVRLYITDNAKAQRVAPRFYPWFETRMKADPRTDQVLTHMETLRQDFEAFGASDWKEQFGSMFRTTYGVTGRVGAATPFRRVHRALYWSATMTEWLEDKATRGIGVKPEQLPMEWRPGKVFAALQSRFQTIENWLEHGPVSPERPDLEPTIPGLLQIADLTHDKWRDFEMYTTALRAKNLRDAKGENVEETVGVKNEWVDRSIDEFGKVPAFRRAAALLQKYRGALLDYQRWGGLIDEKAQENFLKKEPDYRPFLRLMDDDLGERPRRQAGGARVAGLSTGLYKRKGSTRDIMPIFEAYQRMTFLAIDRAERNRAAQSIIKIAKMMPGGDLVHRVPMQEYPVHLSLDRVKQRLVQAGVDPKLVDDALAEHSLTVYLPSWMQPKAPYDWVWEKGKRELYYFDPDLYRAVEGMDLIPDDVISKWMGGFARIHRGGVAVWDPTFWLRQIFPQLLSTGVQAESALRYIKELPSAFAQQARGGPLARKYRRAPTGMSTYMGLDPRALGNLMRLKMLRAAGETPRWWVNPMNLARYFLAYSAKVGMVFEHTPRQAAAQAAGLREATGRSEMMRVGEVARESDINFGRQGWLTARITRVSSFFAPYMIGQERVGREIREHPIRLAWRLNMLLTPLALAVWAWNRRDDENEKQWRQTPRYVKDNYWLVQHPDPKQEPFKFKLPYMYGWWVSGVWAELDRLADKDPETYRLLGRDIVQDINPMPRLVPNAFRSELEIWANQSFYTGRPVYPEGRLPEYTYWPWTTQSAIDLGRAINIPPAILQHEVRGKLGTMGEQALRTADVVRGVERPGDIPAHAAPFFGAFRGAYPVSSGEYVNRFYDVYKQAELVYRTGRLPELLMTGQTGPLFKDRADALRIYASGRGLAAALSGYNRILTILEANPNLTTEQKRAKQEDIYKQKNEMAERWWRATMKLPPPETGRGMIERLLSGEPGEGARPE